MRYMGGKGRIAKKIADTILASTDGRGTYWEPFVGGGATAAQLGRHFNTANYSDIHPDLILMWQSVIHNGWQPPTDVSYELYQELRYTTEPSALRGFVGFGGSFGGRWFEGYARGGHTSDGTPRNHQAESARAVLKDAARMRAKANTNVFVADALTIEPSPGDVVYCDPPYAGTKNYSRTAPFDHDRFWAQAKAWSESGVHVFVSEYKAPEDWQCLWDQPLRSSVRVGSAERHIAVERLFGRDVAPASRADDLLPLFDVLEEVPA